MRTPRAGKGASYNGAPALLNGGVYLFGNFKVRGLVWTGVLGGRPSAIQELPLLPVVLAKILQPGGTYTVTMEPNGVSIRACV